VHRRYDKALRDSANKVPAPGDPKKALVLSGRAFARVDRRRGEVLPLGAERRCRAVPVPGRRKFGWKSSADARGSPELPAYIFLRSRFRAGSARADTAIFRARFWPPEAKEAEIRLWCKLDKTPPEKQASVAGIARKKPCSSRTCPKRLSSLETQRGADGVRSVSDHRDRATSAGRGFGFGQGRDGFPRRNRSNAATTTRPARSCIRSSSRTPPPRKPIDTRFSHRQTKNWRRAPSPPPGP